MTSPDPSAAADAYLQTLPLALRQAADAHTQAAHWQAVAMLAVFLAVCWIAARNGLLVAIRRQAAAQSRPGWMAIDICVGVFAGLLILACAPVAVLLAWRAQGADPIGLAGRVLQGDVLALAVALVAAPLVYLVIHHAPRRWGLWIGAGLGVAVFLVTWAPFALASGPVDLPAAPAGAARAGLEQLIRDTRTPASQIYVSPNPDIDADVTGMPSRARIVVSQGMLAKASPAEIRAAVGHLMGHYAHGDELSLGLLLGLLALGGGLAAQALFTPMARLLGASEVEGPSDPAGLPVLAAILAIWLALAGVGFNNFIRLVNVRADQYSLDYAREPDGLVTSLLKGWRDDRVDPLPLEEAVFYDHPSLRSRLEHALRWKAALRRRVDQAMQLKAANRR